ncbi:MAG: hypothetical protein IPO02_15715 [Bacteroidetes bacterium]|nr:hypothetical protein [Bacteroidota bacterium]
MQNVERTAKEIKDSLKALSNDIFTEPTATAAGMDYMELLTRFGINMLAVFILIRLIYYPTHKTKTFYLPFHFQLYHFSRY